MADIVIFNSKYRIFEEYLEEYSSNIRFTQREIDILACFLNNRTVQNTSVFLNIASRTVGAHLYNVRIKLGNISKNKIIDFVEKSGKLQHLKEYYFCLVYEKLFEEYLSKISQITKKAPKYYNIKVQSLEENQQQKLKELVKQLESFYIYVAEPNNDLGSVHQQIEIVTNTTLSSNNKDIAILFDKPQNYNHLNSDEYIDFTAGDVYLSFATLVDKLCVDKEIAFFTKWFKDEFQKRQSSFDLKNIAQHFPNHTRALKAISLVLISLSICVAVFFLIYSKREKARNITDSNLITFNTPQIFEHHINRPEMLEILWRSFENFDDNRLILVGLHGLGGVGKTVLAKHSVNHPRNKYSFIGWFNGENEESLQSNYVELGEKQRIFSKDISLKNKITLVKEWMENQQNVLLVYDNVSCTDVLEDFLPNKGHVIVTSRNSNVPGALEVGVMSEEESMALLNKLITTKSNAQKPSQESIRILANDLGYLPLALAQAGSYINSNLITVDEYIRLYRNNKDKLLSNKTMPPMDTHLPAYVSWDLSMDKLKQQKSGKQALELLYFATCLNEDDIPKEIISEYMYGKSMDEYDVEINSLLSLLKEYSLIKKTSADSFSIHRLVFSWIVSMSSKKGPPICVKKGPGGVNFLAHLFLIF